MMNNVGMKNKNIMNSVDIFNAMNNIFTEYYRDEQYNM